VLRVFRVAVTAVKNRHAVLVKKQARRCCVLLLLLRVASRRAAADAVIALCFSGQAGEAAHKEAQV
jgi:hypothetical protein